MKISIAQVQPTKGDIESNILRHLRWIKMAIKDQSDLVFFSELSLTSYEPTLAKSLAMSLDDPRLAVFQDLSHQHSITIGLGLPTAASNGQMISMAFFQPDKSLRIYSKRQLHADEKPFFMEGEGQLIVETKNQKIAPAICYESLQRSHIENAQRLGANIYLASVAKDQNGIDKGLAHYPNVAKEFAMPVLMSNCVGFCDNFHSAGQSAVWNKDGRLMAALSSTEEGILTFDTQSEEVSKQ